MILLYRILTILIYPLLFIFLYYRKIIKKEDPIKFKEKILPSCFKVERKAKSKLIWFHAASIGEYKSILPIIERLKRNNQNLAVLITTTTLSSGNLAKKELKKFVNVEHRYLPFDVPFLIDRFFYLWKPNRVFLVDSEIWPNLILTAKKYNIPIALINGRLTAKSFNKWIRFPNVAKKIFNFFDLCLCSNNETKNYLNKLNVKNTFFKGNIKFISRVNFEKIYNINKNILLRKKTWFAASIHEGEDIFCLKTHLNLKKKFNDIITIVAPRHINNTKKIQRLFEKSGLKTQILSENEKILEDKEIIIINYFGALQNFFKYTKSVFMGKSMIEKFKNDGGQNPIEAAKLNCKIYHGPYIYNFSEIYKLLDKKKISYEIKNYKELSHKLELDLTNPIKKSNRVVDPISVLGEKTLIDTMKLVDEFLNHDNK